MITLPKMYICLRFIVDCASAQIPSIEFPFQLLILKDMLLQNNFCPPQLGFQWVTFTCDIRNPR